MTVMTNHVDLAHFFEFKQTKCVNRLRIIFGLMANNDFNNAAVVSCCVTQTCIVLFWHCIFLRRDPIYFPSFRNSLYEQKHKQRSRDCQIRRLSNRCLSIFFKKKTIFHRIIKQNVENQDVRFTCLMCLRNPELSIMILLFFQ